MTRCSDEVKVTTATPSVTDGRPVSGRVWKNKKKRFSKVVNVKSLKKTLEQHKKDKEERQLMKAYERELKEAEKAKREVCVCASSRLHVRLRAVKASETSCGVLERDILLELAMSVAPDSPNLTLSAHTRCCNFMQESKRRAEERKKRKEENLRRGEVVQKVRFGVVRAHAYASSRTPSLLARACRVYPPIVRSCSRTAVNFPYAAALATTQLSARLCRGSAFALYGLLWEVSSGFFLSHLRSP